MHSMGIDISRLSPAAQEQILQKLSLQEWARKKLVETHAKSPKLHEEKVQGYLIDGTPVTFASKREAKRYGELALLQRAGVISDLQFQVRYDLIPSQKKKDGKTERGIYYVADFVYRNADGDTVVEHSKGYRNPSSATCAKFVMKRKLMLYIHGIEVKEV